MRLTDVSIRALPIPARGQKAYRDDGLPGFSVRVSQGGTKTFVLMMGRNRQLITIGRYPIISLADARAEAKRVLAEKMLGKMRPQTMSFVRAVELFLEEKAAECRPSTVASYKRRLAHFHFNDRLSSFGYSDFARMLARIKGPSERDHALVAAKVFFTWTLKRRYILDNPTVGYAQTSHVSRTRVLTEDELKRVWNAAARMGGTYGTIVRLLILAGQRRGELAAFHSRWLNQSEMTVTLPAEVTKNRREHTFPVSSSFVSLLEMPDVPGLIFPARGKPGQLFSGWSKSKKKLDRLACVHNWTLHDIRRTVASNLAALGVSLPVIERLLNHVSGSFGGIVSVYQRHSFMPEMRAAMALWDRKLQELLAN